MSFKIKNFEEIQSAKNGFSQQFKYNIALKAPKFDLNVINAKDSYSIKFTQKFANITSHTDIKDIPRIALTGDVDITKKLKIKEMRVKNFNLVRDNNIIKKISAIVPYKKIEVYITKLGWKWINTKSGYFEYKPNFTLQKFRNRVIFRYNNEVFIKMITKER